LVQLLASLPRDLDERTARNIDRLAEEIRD